MRISEEKILDVALKLFKEKSVGAVRMQDIARACGVSLWDVNEKFKSKKDLILALIRCILRKKSTFLLVSSSISPSPVTELNNFLKFMHENIVELGPSIFIQLGRYHPVALDQLKEVVELTLMPYMQTVIERGIDEGFCRHELDREMYVASYFDTIRKAIEKNASNWTETQRLVVHINDIYFHGALNVKGMRV